MARFLPARLGAIIIQYMAYIRPVANLLRRERDHYRNKLQPEFQSRFLFQKDQKRWLSSRVTAIIGSAALKVWQQQLTVQMYRQIAIGITEKHVREVYKPFNQYNDRGVDADRNVVFAWQSGHRPLQRGITYGLDGAYPHQLQPALLRIYEWASAKWHEFIGLQSKLTEDVEAVNSISKAMPKANKSQAKDRSKKGRVEHLRMPASQAVTVLQAHRLAVCTHCKLAIHPGPGIEAHFRRKHCVVDDDLICIKRSYSTLKLNNPDTILLPDDYSKPIPELFVYKGYTCHLCKYITRAKGVLQQHMKQQHSGERVTTTNAVSVQTFTYTMPRYWIVDMEKE